MAPGSAVPSAVTPASPGSPMVLRLGLVVLWLHPGLAPFQKSRKKGKNALMGSPGMGIGLVALANCWHELFARARR